MFNLKAFLAELIGTFILVLVVAAAGIVSGAGGGPVGNALTGGLALAALVYVFGHISGAHVNPAVTFAMALNGSVKWVQAVFYWVAQFAGAVLAAWLMNYFVTTLGGTIDGGASLGALNNPGSATTQTRMMAMAFEAILTFLLVAAYLQAVASGKGGSAGAWAYGAVYSMAVLAGGLFTGASLNPARTLGVAFFTSETVQSFKDPFLYVVYFVGPLFGATLAVLAYNYFNGIMDVVDDDEDEEDAVEEEQAA
ncbi:MAG: MIP/aquaporin family protein [Chloroflexota bacterium]